MRRLLLAGGLALAGAALAQQASVESDSQLAALRAEVDRLRMELASARLAPTPPDWGRVSTSPVLPAPMPFMPHGAPNPVRGVAPPLSPLRSQMLWMYLPFELVGGPGWPGGQTCPRCLPCRCTTP